MRIDTMTFLNTSLTGIQSNQTAIARLNQQIATGLTMNATKDDPVTSVKAMELSNRIAVRTQYAANQDKAELDLNYETVVMKEMSSALNQARALLVGISPSNSTSLRNVHAEQLKGVFNQILDLANTRDPSGNYIFSGFETSTVPFANTSDFATASVQPTVYSGTPTPDGVRNIEVESGRLLQANDNISNVFQFTDATIVDPVNLFDPTSHDVLQNLADAIVNLPIPGGINDTDLKGYMDVLDKSLGQLELIQHRIAGSLTELKDLRATTQALLLNEKNALSDMTQVDQAAAIVELQSRQTTLEAISRAYALTSGLSLFNYLS